MTWNPIATGRRDEGNCQKNLRNAEISSSEPGPRTPDANTDLPLPNLSVSDKWSAKYTPSLK